MSGHYNAKILQETRFANKLKLVELLLIYPQEKVEEALKGVTVNRDGTFDITIKKNVKPIPKRLGPGG